MFDDIYEMVVVSVLLVISVLLLVTAAVLELLVLDVVHLVIAIQFPRFMIENPFFAFYNEVSDCQGRDTWIWR